MMRYSVYLPVLMVLVLGFGYVLVKNAYESRRLFTELEAARNEAQRLDADHERLLAERHTQATNLRVEQVARERLHMRPITPAISQSVSLHAAAPAAASAPAQP